MSAPKLSSFMDGPAGAPVLVLLHAIATHSDLWLAQLPAWCTRFRTLRIDLPGHGASAAPTAPLDLQGYARAVREVLDERQVERAALVGLSLGGMVAQAFALAWPQRTRALVLAHTSAQTPPAARDLWEHRLSRFEAEGLDTQVAPTLERWFTPEFRRASPLTMRWMAQQIRATSPAGYVSAIGAIRGLDHLPRLKEIHAPTLVVAGESDTAVPMAASAALADGIGAAHLLVLPGAAHIGNVQQPLAFTEHVGAFLARALEQQESRT